MNETDKILDKWDTSQLHAPDQEDPFLIVDFSCPRDVGQDQFNDLVKSVQGLCLMVAERPRLAMG